MNSSIKISSLEKTAEFATLDNHYVPRETMCPLYQIRRHLGLRYMWAYRALPSSTTVTFLTPEWVLALVDTFTRGLSPV